MAKRIGQLATRAAKEAGYIARWLDERGESSVTLGGIDFELCRYRPRFANGETIHLGLYVSRQDDESRFSGDLTAGKAGNGTDGTYLYGDFGCWQSHPTPAVVRAFIDALPAIEAEIAAIDSRDDESDAARLEALGK